MIILKTKTATLLAILVDEDAYRPTLVTNPNLKNRFERFEWTSKKNGREHSIFIPNIDQWEEFGFAWELTEKECIRIVDTIKTFNGTGKYECYTAGWGKAKHTGFTCMTARSSATSLFQSKNMKLKLNYYLLKLKPNSNKGSAK